MAANTLRTYAPSLSRLFSGDVRLISGDLSRMKLAVWLKLCPGRSISEESGLSTSGNVYFAMNVHLHSRKIRFTNDYRIAVNKRENLIVYPGRENLKLDDDTIRKEIKKLFRGAKLRQVSAGGDNSCELELNACGNVNFDMGRYGIEFVASPRHADGIVITGPVTSNMAEALRYFL